LSALFSLNPITNAENTGFEGKQSEFAHYRLVGERVLVMVCSEDTILMLAKSKLPIDHPSILFSRGLLLLLVLLQLLPLALASSQLSLCDQVFQAL
jgi:hypothetical protein